MTLMCHTCSTRMKDIKEYDFRQSVVRKLAVCKKCKRQVVTSERAMLVKDEEVYRHYGGGKNKRFIGTPDE